MRSGMKLAIWALLSSAGALAQESFAIRGPKNQKVPRAEAEKVYLSACAVVKREFSRTTAIRPQLTLVLRAPTAAVDRDKREVRLPNRDGICSRRG